MFHRMRTITGVALLLALPAAAHAALSAYTQNFEALVLASPTALSADGWVVYGNVYSPSMVFLYGYGTFPAPNGGSNFCAIASGQGGVQQGNQQLSVYSDYNNTDHGLGRWIESNTFHEQTISAADVGHSWTFQFDAKLGNLVSPSTALAFIKTLNPAAGYATTNFLTVNTTSIPTSWNTYSISIPITADLVGQLLQFGFSNTATLYQSSGVFYDNIDWKLGSTTSVGTNGLSALDLRPAAPNPFRGSTHLDYALARAGFAEVAIFDVSGRLVKTLFRGEAAAGSNAVRWDGRSEDGRRVAAGVYHAVLRTADGRVTRNLVLTP